MTFPIGVPAKKPIYHHIKIQDQWLPNIATFGDWTMMLSEGIPDQYIIISTWDLYGILRSRNDCPTAIYVSMSDLSSVQPGSAFRQTGSFWSMYQGTTRGRSGPCSLFCSYSYNFVTCWNTGSPTCHNFFSVKGQNWPQESDYQLIHNSWIKLIWFDKIAARSFVAAVYRQTYLWFSWWLGAHLIPSQFID